jgi:ribosome biogenesis GTPase A
MRVRYIFSSRRTRRIENIAKQRQKYPAVLLKVIEISDIIIQVLDARFFNEMRNKEIEEIIKKEKKQIIYVLNKADLVEREKIKKSQLEEIKPYVFTSCAKRSGIKELRDKIKQTSKSVKKSPDNKYDRIQVGIIGYPNTGKSSLINLLIGKMSAGVGSQAGYTKGMQKIKLTKDLLLLDSPGVIPSNDYSQHEQEKIIKHQKVGGKSFSQIKDPETLVVELVKEYSKQIDKYYKIDSKGDSEKLIEELGKRKGFLKKGGEVNYDKTSREIVKDFQEGKIKI